MRFLADESCDFAAVEALRSAGHDVLAVCETIPGEDDQGVLSRSLAEERILVTEDKDFGWWIYAASHRTMGVMLLRYPVNLRRTIADTVVNCVRTQGESLIGCFVVIQPGRIRIDRRGD